MILHTLLDSIEFLSFFNKSQKRYCFNDTTRGESKSSRFVEIKFSVGKKSSRR